MEFSNRFNPIDGAASARGLASVVFAILAVESLETSTLLDDAVGVVAMTIAFSVVLHGLVSTTQLEELLVAQPNAIQEEIIQINSDAGNLALQLRCWCPSSPVSSGSSTPSE